MPGSHPSPMTLIETVMLPCSPMGGESPFAWNGKKARSGSYCLHRSVSFHIVAGSDEETHQVPFASSGTWW